MKFTWIIVAMSLNLSSISRAAAAAAGASPTEKPVKVAPGPGKTTKQKLVEELISTGIFKGLENLPEIATFLYLISIREGSVVKGVDISSSAFKADLKAASDRTIPGLRKTIADATAAYAERRYTEEELAIYLKFLRTSAGKKMVTDSAYMPPAIFNAFASASERLGKVMDQLIAEKAKR